MSLADDARLVDAQVERLGVVHVAASAESASGEDDVGRVLDHAGNRRELVEHAVDLHRGDAAPSIEESSTRRSALPIVVPKPALERLRVEAPEPVGERLASKSSRWGVENLSRASFFLSPTGGQPRLQACGLSPPASRCSLQAAGRWLESAGSWQLAAGRKNPVRAVRCRLPLLLRVQLDDQLLLYGQVDLLAVGTEPTRADIPSRRTPAIPARRVPSLPGRVLDRRVLAAALPHRDDVTRLDRERRDITFLPFTVKWPCGQLPCGWPRGRETETVVTLSSAVRAAATASARDAARPLAVRSSGGTDPRARRKCA